MSNLKKLVEKLDQNQTSKIKGGGPNQTLTIEEAILFSGGHQQGRNFGDIGQAIIATPTSTKK